MAQYVFVGGCRHSGTSLLSAMLGAHSRIYSIPVETGCFLKSKRGKLDEEMCQRLEAHGNECDKSDAKYICEKTPAHIRRFDEARRLYPDASFLATIRDPRDVLTSVKRRGLTTRSAIRNWRKATVCLERWQNAGYPILGVRFESLVVDPEPTLTRICEFLGLPYEAGMLDYWKDSRAWYQAKQLRRPDSERGKDHREYRNWQIHQPLMRDRIGTYQAALTASELEEVAEELSDLAARYGYALRSEPGSTVAETAALPEAGVQAERSL